jgi:hypothetical protein
LNINELAEACFISTDAFQLFLKLLSAAFKGENLVQNGAAHSRNIRLGYSDEATCILHADVQAEQQADSVFVAIGGIAQ